MKKVENMPMTSRPRMTLEPVSVRSFRMRSGMIGLASCDSRTMKATNERDGDGRGCRACAPSPSRTVDAVTMA